jgi:uncharacterized protein with PQ loop repeat
MGYVLLNLTMLTLLSISLSFLIVWMIGDVTNLLGAFWAQLVPTVIALAIYFCLADFVLISQCLYYNALNARRQARSRAHSGAAEEYDPLLERSRQSSEISQASTIGLPGSHTRRRSSASTLTRREDNVLARAMDQIREEEDDEIREGWVRNTVSILLVCSVGTIGWFFAWKSGVWQPAPSEGKIEELSKTPVGALVLGYFSAVCYLGARLPQIILNQKRRSCDGLSLTFFLLSLIGNATYGAGILFHSIEREYVMKNLPWLIGSIGTIAYVARSLFGQITDLRREDCIIFVQFSMFSTARRNDSAVV